MKVIQTVLLFLLLTGSVAVQAQTQMEMNRNASDALKKVEAELEDIYNKVLVEYKEDKAFVKQLKKSQKIWHKLKRTDLDLKFPEKEPGYYGSIYPLCVATYLEAYTQKRVEQLKPWLEGAIEGDACNGSIK